VAPENASVTVGFINPVGLSICSGVSIATDSVVGSVVVSAAAGDETAFAQIIARYDDDLARVAYLVTADIGLAHDAVQAAWPIAWRKLGSLRDLDRIRPWLVAIAVNEARQLLRRQRRQRVVEISMERLPEASPNRPTSVSADQHLDLLDALRALSSDDRAIVAMRYALGLNSDEIGQAIGLSAPGVRSRLARCVALLRKDLTDV
jgi:RNA polymerase sigma factor (sigma-70 family)